MLLSTQREYLPVESRDLDKLHTAEDQEILFNSVRRSFKCPGLGGARVRAGTIDSLSYSGLGDSVLFDFKNGFFAAADSSDRHSAASRKFLIKFTRMLEGFSDFNPDRVFSLDQLSGIKNMLIEGSDEVLKTVPYTESCTFTGVLRVKTDIGMKGILLHTGDSLLLRYNAKSDELRQITENNFWMVGRSKHLFQIEEIDIEPGTLFLVTTDGFSDLNKGGNDIIAEFPGTIKSDYAIEEIVDVLFDNRYLDEKPSDDIGLMLIDPHNIRLFDKTIIIGGTTGQEERKYQERCNSGFYSDSYLPLREESETVIIL